MLRNTDLVKTDVHLLSRSCRAISKQRHFTTTANTLVDVLHFAGLSLINAPFDETCTDSITTNQSWRLQTTVELLTDSDGISMLPAESYAIKKRRGKKNGTRVKDDGHIKAR